MYEYYDKKFQKTAINLAPGEYFSSGDDIVIETVLGSCVSVVIYDPVLKIGGMNHFMLAESKLEYVHSKHSSSERYGLFAMDALISGMVKYGAREDRMKAKVFGGARVLNMSSKLDIGAENIKYANKYLKEEGIPVISSDTGGTRARRIYLCANSFRVFVKMIESTPNIDRYSEQIKNKVEKGGDAIIF